MLPRWLTEERQLVQLVHPLIAFGVAIALFLVIRYLVLRALARQDGPRSMPRLIVETIRLPSLFWCLAAGLRLALDFTQLSDKAASRTGQWIGAFVIFSLALVAASVAVRWMSAYGERQGMPFAAAGLSRALIRLLVLGLGIMALLANFGLAITPLLTALGVGGIAVALALQDTLANLFAGIHILVERPITVGHNIRLENGMEGVVTDIGWRTTRLKTSANDTVVVPNTKITSTILVNSSLPDRRAVVDVPILVGHDADPDTVCRLAIEEAIHAGGVLEDPAPVCLCEPGVLPTHLQFKLQFGVASRLDQPTVQSQVRLRVLRRFLTEGIPLPNPELARVHADRR